MEYNQTDYENLAIYNAERLRGLLHEPKWIDYMAKVQRQYNAEHGVDALVVWSGDEPADRLDRLENAFLRQHPVEAIAIRGQFS